jgi:hypothetical protein
MKKHNTDNTNKITFLQAYPHLVDVFPLPEPGTKNVPQWYKDQPSISGPDEDTPQNGSFKLTVKKCQAFFDAMAVGYILKVPVDIYVDTTDGKFEIQLPGEMQRFQQELIAHHSSEQISRFPMDAGIYVNQVFRIHPTWMVKTPPGYSTLFMQPMHQPPSPLQAVEAIIDTDEFFSDGHLSFFVKKNFKGVIKQGTPLAQVFPFKREDWSMELDKEWDPEKTNLQRRVVRSMFQNGYRIKHWHRKVFK